MAWYDPRTWFRAGEKPVERIDEPDNGADSSGDYPRDPGFGQLESMAAMARFAYVHAAASRRAADMASLPIKLYAGNPERDPDAEEVYSHPLIDLLERPNLDETGEELRRQAAVDLMLPGNSYLLKVGATSEIPPLSLVRYHPDECRIIPSRFGRKIQAFALGVGEAEQRVEPGLVLHTRGPSWRPGASGLYGQGNIEALSDELTTKLRAREHQMKLAGQGRPDVVLSPSDSDDNWSPEDRQNILRAWAKMTKTDGPLVLGGAAKADFLNLSPRDMEYAALDDRIISAVMASLQTPPIILGRPTANYATARQQDAVYWRGIAHDARLFDAVWTVGLAWLYPEIGGRRLYLRHDFSAVLPLQGERTAQVERAHKHIAAGAIPSEAYAYEGLAGAPVSDEPIEILAPAPSPEAPVAPPEAAAPDEPEVEAAEVDTDDEVDEEFGRAMNRTPDDRTKWERWLVKTHKPAEKRMRAAVRRYLVEARKRYAERLAASFAESGKAFAVVGSPGWETRGIPVEDVVAAGDEVAAALSALGGVWRRTWLLSAVEAADELPIDDVSFDPDDAAVVNLIREFVDVITETQAVAVRAIVEEGIESGRTVGQMQEDLHRSAAFGASRALRIARTESTRAVNLGTMTAYQQAADLGLEVRKVWLTAASGERHPSYPGLDGQERALDEDFDLDGVPSPHPGGSGVASEDINCRCTTEAKVSGGDPLF